MTTAAPSIKSTVKSTTPASTFKPRVRRLGEGRYLVESASHPGRGHTTTATSCTCTGFSYRKTCRHMTLVQALEPSMTAWYGQAATPAAPAPVEAPQVVPMSAGAPSGIKRPVRGGPISSSDAALDEAERLLAIKRRALADAHPQDDSYATLLRQVDQAERAVAAANYALMRAA